MRDGLLDRLGLGALAGFAVGVAVASHPGDQRSLQEFARATLAECLRLLDDPRLVAALPAAATAAPLAGALPPPATDAPAETGPTEAPRPRRRRRTRAEIEADAAAAARAAAAPAPEAATPPRRRGRPPAPRPTPVAAIVASEVGAPPDQVAPSLPEEQPQPARRGRRARQLLEAAGDGAAPTAPPPLETSPVAAEEEPAPAADGTATGDKLNLNTATRGDIMRLPRIGAQAADRILAFREEQGRINGARQLRQAEVVSASQWRQIRDLVRF